MPDDAVRRDRSFAPRVLSSFQLFDSAWRGTCLGPAPRLVSCLQKLFQKIV